MKLLAYCAVIGWHMLNRQISTCNALMYYACGFAIPVFMFCSGYILLQRESVTFRYCIIRVLKILRVALSWSFIISACMLILQLTRNENIDLASLIKNIIYYPFIQKGYLWQFWYLGALVIIYFFLPAIHKIT